MYFGRRVLFTIIFAGINLVAMITLLVVGLVIKNVDVFQTGYAICAILCLMLIFLRLARMNRLIFRGRISAYDYKQSDDYRETRYENYASLIAIALYIIFVFAFTPLF